MNISIPTEIEQALIQQANQRNTTPEQIALDALREHFVTSCEKEKPSTDQKTLAEAWSNYIGIVDSSEFMEGPSQLSIESGKKFAEEVLKDHRNG